MFLRVFIFLIIFPAKLVSNEVPITEITRYLNDAFSTPTCSSQLTQVSSKTSPRADRMEKLFKHWLSATQSRSRSILNQLEIIKTMLPSLNTAQREDVMKLTDHILDTHPLIGENLELFSKDINFTGLVEALEKADGPTRAILYVRLAFAVPDALTYSLLINEVSTSSAAESIEVERTDADPVTGQVSHFGLSYSSLPKPTRSEQDFVTSLLIDWFGARIGKKLAPIILTRSFTGSAYKNEIKRESRLWYYYKVMQFRKLPLDETAIQTIWLIENILQRSVANDNR